MSLRQSRRQGSSYKTFFSLTDNDFIYQINPISQKIEGLKIKEIRGCVERNERGEVINAQKNQRKVAITVFRKEVVFHSQDLDKMPTVTYIMPGDLTMTLVFVKVEGFDTKVPVPMSASHKALKAWKERKR